MIRRTIVAAVAAVTVLGACTGENAPGGSLPSISLPDNGGGDEPPAEEPPAEEPPAEEPPAEEPPAEEPAEDDGLSSEDWLLIAILGLGALAIIIGATSAASRHSERKAAASNEMRRRLGEITGGARWIASSGVNDVLSTSDPEQLAAMWAGERARYIDVESKAAAMAGTTGDSGLDQSLHYFGQSVANLRGAVGSYVTLRTAPDAASNTTALHNAAQNVTMRAQEVNGALAPLEGAMR